MAGRPETLPDLIASRGRDETREAFAARAGLSAKTLYNLCTDGKKPTRPTLEKLAKALKCGVKRVAAACAESRERPES